MSSYTTALNLVILTPIILTAYLGIIFVGNVPDEHGVGFMGRYWPVIFPTMMGYVVVAVFGARYTPGDPNVLLVPLFLYWEFAEWFPVEVSVVLVVFTLLLGLVVRERGFTI